MELPDHRDRMAAAGIFDRNLVVTAGAGTGKTTLLVDRLVHLLLRNPDPLKITEIVALTFTNKAADEIRLRLRLRLQTYRDIRLDRGAADESTAKIQREVEALVALYRLSKDELDGRVHDALRNLERSDIGTIHSFAASLLRLYPLEAGVDPQFHEDDGAAFERLFDEQWELWLDRELSLRGSHAEDWRRVLARWQLHQIKALAKSIAAETVDLKENATGAAAVAPALRRWLGRLRDKAAALMERHPEDRLNERLVRMARDVIGEFLKGGNLPAEVKDEFGLLLEKSINRKLKGWPPEDVAEAQEFVRAARGLVRVDGESTAALWRLLAPCAGEFRERFVRDGYLSFDALLVRARDLLRDQPRVRAELKRRYHAILIDEFQDTDPIQYEILLYLAERPGREAKDWRAVKLLPGKIFVVGDPKQSIYAFRRADIEAYLEVVEKIIKAQHGKECRLTTNFRSHAEILDAVNGIFQTLIQAQDVVQPAYIAIHPAPGRLAAPSAMPKVLVRKIVSENEAMDAETARRLEGESLARWLKEEVLEKVALFNARGETVLAQPRDVAILLRKLTDIHDYLEPLRRQGIRYVVEGERHFYAAKEIIDAVNLLRAVENPHDRLALVGVLRSPLGALTDQEIYDLHRQNLLDYRAAERPAAKSLPPNLKLLYDTLARLHEETRRMATGAAIAHVFATLPVELLAACYFHGEQAVANLQKLAQQAELLGREGWTTLKQAIRELEARVLEVKDEGESVLAEENLDAVRIMSIHKAKGLEFPIVILAGCQAGTEGRRNADAEALFDWSTGLTGLRIGANFDLAGLYIAEKTRLRTVEEQKRLLYVAMTRARENLIISCAPGGRRSAGSFLSMLDAALEESISRAEASKTVCAGAGKVAVAVVREKLIPPGRARGQTAHKRQTPAWRSWIEIWARRRAGYEKIRHAPAFLTPTLLKRQEEIFTESGSEAKGRIDRSAAAVIGDLAHRFLQGWDFSADIKGLPAQLGAFVAEALPAETEPSRRRIESELEDIFQAFAASTAYAEIAGARILGREVPFLVPWNGQIMEGVIDLCYEKGGLLYLADYKTDRVDPAELSGAASRYRQQAEIYSEAAKRSLNRAVAGFKLIFLRLGKAVEMMAAREGQLSLFDYENPLS
jgi:ATP-dependent helicase/nuclease subunit A